MSPLNGISSMATRDLLGDLAAAWGRRGEGGLHVESVGGVAAAARVRAGEAFDVVVLAADAIDALAAAGFVVASSRTDLVRSEVVIAVGSGRERPGVDTDNDLRSAVQSARSIGISTGPSGVAVVELFRRWGLLESLQARLVQAPPGVPVASLLARGDVELGFQQRSELSNVDGIEVLGPMPPGTEIVTVFAAACCAASTRPDVVGRLLDFMASADTAAIKRRHGMQPA